MSFVPVLGYMATRMRPIPYPVCDTQPQAYWFSFKETHILLTKLSNFLKHLSTQGFSKHYPTEWNSGFIGDYF